MIVTAKTAYLKLQKTAQACAREIAPLAEETDQQGEWPEHAIRLLGDAHLMGLHAPTEVGGLGLGFAALAVVTEQLGAACGSSGLVYGMHCVGSKVIEVNATDYQRQHYLEPIAAGEHVTSLSLSEPGTGVHFYLPRTTFYRDGDHFVVEGVKSFVTSGSHADSYVVSVVAKGSDMDPGTFSCLLVDKGLEGMEWGEPWDGFGMRGNSSRTLTLNKVRVPIENLLGEEGDETWYVFEVIAPYFIVAMAGVYLGIAQAAVDEVIRHLKTRVHNHTGGALATEDVLSQRVASLWTAVERSRQLLYHAAQAADAGRPEWRTAILACKADIADMATHVTNEAMTLTGGIGYAGNGKIGRLLRDARAAHIMSPSTDLLRSWLGRSLLDLPLL